MSIYGAKLKNLFKYIPTSKELIDKYKEQYPNLKHVRTDKENKGIMCLDKDTFVGIVQWDENSKYIVALEVNPKYRHQGIATKLLNIAKRKGIKNLSVNKNNSNAIDLYKDNKYKIKKQDDHMYYMLAENFIISKDDLYINFDKWKKEKGHNILFITGLSGSGKSTLAEEMEKKYHAEMFELDGMYNNYDSSKSNILNNVKQKFPQYKNEIENNFKDMERTKIFSISTKLIKYAISEMEKEYNKLYIVEGIQIFEAFDPDKIKNKPIIIKGTSATKSLFQRFKREGNGKIDWIKELKDHFLGMCKWYGEEEKMLHKFKKSIKEESVVYKKNNGVFSKQDFDNENGSANIGVLMSKDLEDPYCVNSLMSTLNHSDNPNCKIDIFSPEDNKNKQIIGLTQIRPFKKDEEITIDYYSLPDEALDVLVNEQSIFLNEASQNKAEKKFKCPFCDYHNTKVKLVDHINEVHKDMIPKDYTAARILFNYLNHKEHGTCIVCKGETPWDEGKWRYDRMCGKKKCHNTFIQNMRTGMIKTHGKANLLGDVEFQKKMLAGRSISGRYKFQDGQYKDYVGSYEHKFLEFVDKVLNIKSKDIFAPGPTVEYEFKGEKLKWITDFFYDPYNLVIEVKDGGDNPNSRNMKEYRAKQIAKEKAITKLNKYNYIRLTNNNFQQFLLTMMEIKEELQDNHKQTNVIIDINEFGVAGLGGALPPATDQGAAYIIPCTMNNTYVGSALSNDKHLRNIYRVKDGKIHKDSTNYLFDKDYEIYKVKKDIDMEAVLDPGRILESKDYFYTAITNKELLDHDQYNFDESFEKVTDPYVDLIDNLRNVNESIIYKFNKALDKDFDIDIVNEQEVHDKEIKLSKCKNVDIKKDINGYFLCNTINDCRSKSYKSINEIPENQYNNIQNLKI